MPTMENISELEEYLKRCRLCADDHRLGINIFGDEGVEFDVRAKIKALLGINVREKDKLPKNICYQCLFKIESFRNFKKACKEAEHTLRNWHLFYGGFSETEETDAESDGGGGSKISVESVAQPTTTALSQMAESAINSQVRQKSEDTNKKASPNEKVDVVTMRQDKGDVSHILLNMTGVGTIAVTKYGSSKEQEQEQELEQEQEEEDDDQVDAVEIGETLEIEENVEETPQPPSTEGSIILSDDEDTDGFSGFDFDEPSSMDAGDDEVKDEAEEVLVGEFVPNDSIQFEHLELKPNGEVKPVVAKQAAEDAMKYTLVTVDSYGVSRYACMKCNKSFAQKSYVKEHMKIHTGEKPFPCTVCGRAFRNNYMLKVHFRLHTGEKNFKCEDCTATFTERGALVSHSRTHTGDKPYSCTYCDRKFAQNPALKRHLRVHTKEKPYTCEQCGTSFADRGTWKNHVRTHTGERPYRCTLCGKTFVQRANLQAHVRTHTDERPHPCQVCGSSFRAKAHLIKHLSTVHRDVMRSVATFMKDPTAELPEGIIVTSN